jgi:Xaa-Pro aminopeptidase
METRPMLSDDLIARLSRVATFSSDPAEVGPRLRRLVQTPSNRWRMDWIAELFPGISESDKAALLWSIGQWRPPAQHFVAERLVAVRNQLAKLSASGFVVPQNDEHQGEFIPPRNQRLAWLTGFTGSAGTAVITMDKAWLFVDGRYVEQAKRQVDSSAIEVRHFKKPPTWQFLAGALSPASRLGYDPALHAVTEIEMVQKEVAKARIELVAVNDNPIDALWSDRPAPAFSPVVVQPTALRSRRSLRPRKSTPRCSTSSIRSPGFTMSEAATWPTLLSSTASPSSTPTDIPTCSSKLKSSPRRRANTSRITSPCAQWRNSARRCAIWASAVLQWASTRCG